MMKTVFACKEYRLEDVLSTIRAKKMEPCQEREYYIAEEKELSNRDWAHLTTHLLDDRDWIAEFSSADYPATEEGTPCIRVTAPDSEIALIIDPQRYPYARYVGMEEVGRPEEDDQEEEPEDESSEIEEEPEDESSVIEEADVEDALLGMLRGDCDIDDTALGNCRTCSFADGGVMTYNKGLVISLPDGSEFQLTIVRSR